MPADKSVQERAAAAFVALHKRVAREGYRGYEFDDFLAAKSMRALAGDSLLRKRIIIQVGERLPLNIRPLVGVPKLESTKARGYFAKGYLWYYRWSSEPHWLEAADACLDWLLKHSSSGYAGLAWGNQFDFASRGGFFPKDLPTVVWSAHIAEAMGLADSIAPNTRYRQAIERVAEFIAISLGSSEDTNGMWLHYAPGLPNKIHNSNLLGAAILARVSHDGHRQDWREMAIHAYEWSLSHWQPDGSWLYGASPNYSWVDNFHTAYMIESLLTGHDLLGEEKVPWSVIDRSVEYWLTHFFDDNGCPRYYNNKKYPLDIQCAAQAIETLSRLGDRFPACRPLATQVTSWTLDHMHKPNGAFRYRINRSGIRNNLEPIHWGQATMLSALGAYLYHSSGKNDEGHNP